MLLEFVRVIDDTVGVVNRSTGIATCILGTEVLVNPEEEGVTFELFDGSLKIFQLLLVLRLDTFFGFAGSPSTNVPLSKSIASMSGSDEFEGGVNGGICNEEE